MPTRRVRSTGTNWIGAFPSLIERRMVAYESTIERDALFFFEFDRAICGCHEQPFTRSKAFSDGATHTYTPDFLLTTTTRPVLVECKPATRVDDNDTRRQIEIGRDWAEEQGSEFVLLTDAALRVGPTLTNLKILFRYSRLRITDEVAARCVSFLERRREGASFLETAAALVADEGGEEPLSRAPLLYHLLFRHTLRADLTRPLTPLSTLWLPSSRAGADDTKEDALWRFCASR